MTGGWRTWGLAVALCGLNMVGSGGPAESKPQSESVKKITRTDAEWKKLLTAEQYRVLRTKGTEVAFTGAYWNEHRKGVYRCAGCGLELFRSDQKFDSGTGWPSFWAPIDKSRITDHVDRTFGMTRIESTCARCGGHLGHVFDDGPEPTGMRYCMNSVSLKFVPAK